MNHRTDLVWLTDIHLAHLPTGGSRAFGEEVRRAHPNMKTALVTGDIAEAATFEALLEEFAEGADADVHFVLGNHDFSGSSIHAVRMRAASMTQGRIRWLVNAPGGYVPLGNDVILVGHDGWYDARNGQPKGVLEPDRSTIREFATIKPGSFVRAVSDLADRFATEARELLLRALAAGSHKQIVFATHVPPYKEASWHEGKISDDSWLPWMSSRVMGEMLSDVASRNPGREFLILCGHTHSAGESQPLPNVTVRTGTAVYGKPRVSGVLPILNGRMTTPSFFTRI
jgi:Icc protein